MILHLRPATVADVPRLVEHFYRHLPESGRGGAPHFGPPPVLSPAEIIERLTDGLSRPLDAPGWERSFVLVSNPSAPNLDDVKILGHAELRADGMPSRSHRACLGMGIERAYTRRGYGPRLLQAVLAFAREETSLAWVDLGVFAQNRPAHELYLRAGFVETGRVVDMFRMPDGTRIDDIQMTLAIPRTVTR